MATRAPMEKLPREGSWVQAPGREEMLQVVPTPGEAQPHRAGGCVGLSRVPARCAHVCRCCGWDGSCREAGTSALLGTSTGESPRDAAQGPVLSPHHAPERLSPTEPRLLRSRRAAARSPWDHTP